MCFLWAKGLCAKDIHKKVSCLWWECLSKKTVHNLVKKFSYGPSKVTDEIVTEATALGCSHGLAYSIMHDLLKIHKVCAWWVSRELKD
jgi:hypothetical protein